MLFHLPLPIGRNRRPDVAFVPYTRWRKNRPIPSVNAWDVLPDVCVEEVSPNDLIDELMDKLVEYFRSGVRQVGVV
jgi:Uma2 family endonuclease